MTLCLLSADRQGGADAVAPAVRAALAEQKFQQVHRLPPLRAEGTETPFTAAENDPISRKFVEPPLPHLGADLGAQSVGHVEVSAADGAAAGVLRLGEAAPTSFQQLPRRLLLDQVASGGAGVVPDKTFSLWRGARSRGCTISTSSGQMGRTSKPASSRSCKVQLGQAV